LPEVGKYAVGVIFLDKNDEEASSNAEKEFSKLAENCNLTVCCCRN
jgi:glutamate synthase domain-containing protein 1